MRHATRDIQFTEREEVGPQVKTGQRSLRAIHQNIARRYWPPPLEDHSWRSMAAGFTNCSGRPADGRVTVRGGAAVDREVPTNWDCQEGEEEPATICDKGDANRHQPTDIPRVQQAGIL